MLYGSGRVAVLLFVACLYASAASAQNPQGRPFLGLFGANNAPDPASRQTAAFTLSLLQAYDTNVVGDEALGGLRDPRFQISGLYSGLNLGLAYAANWRRVTLTTRAGSDLQYSPDSRLTMITPQGSASILVNLVNTPKITLRAQQGAGYLPYRFLSFFPRLSEAGVEAVSVPGVDFAISTVAGYDYRSELGFDYRAGKRSSLSLAYTRMAVDYRGQGTGLIEDRLFGGLRHRLTNDATLRLGYGQRRGSSPSFVNGAAVRAHELDVGLDYNRALSLTRKTSIAFGSGAAAAGSDGARLAYYLTGKAALNHQFGRTWGAGLFYNRALQLQEGLAVPFMSDTVSADLGGYLGRRVDLGLTTALASGASNPSVSRSTYLTYTGTARARVALSRYGAVYIQYFQYSYQFKDAAQVIAGLPRAMDRRGVRVGLTLWLPLLR